MTAHRASAGIPLEPERVRFSPAPSGGLHVGNARTALFTWLLARSTGGAFIVRIEDTDARSVVEGAEEAILHGLRWMGLGWDEGPDVGGPHAPYRQSERHPVYADALARLREAGRAYLCFCDAEQLARDRAEDANAGRAPKYRGRCRSLEPREGEARLATGEPAAWRFAVEPTETVEFEDRVFGKITAPAGSLGDFVIVRTDGSATFDLANVADDAAMGITTVVRGDDHLANTPRHIMLARALGGEPPRFAHLPLVTGVNGQPLSKSGGAAAINELEAKGFLAEGLANHLALLGWSDPQGREVLTRADLVAAFDLTRVSRAPAVHDPERLRHLNAQHLRAFGDEELTRFLEPWARALPPWIDRRALAEAMRAEVAVGEDIAALAAPLAAPLAVDVEAQAALTANGAREALEIASSVLEDPTLPSDGEALVLAMRARAAEVGIKPKTLLPAVRAALTGRAHGLPVGAVMGLVGRERAKERVAASLTPARGGRDS